MNEEARRNGNEQAFATPGVSFPDGSLISGEYGLTKREWFAGLAMAAMWSNPELWKHEGFTRDGCAKEAALAADALLAALSQEDKK